MHLRKILFPVDLSTRCEQAAPYVRSFASDFHVEVHLLHVIEAAPDPAQRHLLDEFAPTVFPPLLVNRLVQCGDAAHTICETAHTGHFDLIALPTHGHGLFRRFLLGSVTSKVLHDAGVPVLTLPHAGEPAAPNSRIQTIVCGVDVGDENRQTIAYAAELAEHFGARVNLVHVIPASQIASEFPGAERSHGELATCIRHRIDALQAAVGTNLDLSLAMGAVATALAQSAQAMEAQLIVIGRGHPHDPLGRLRTHVSSIIHHAPCPVLSV